MKRLAARVRGQARARDELGSHARARGAIQRRIQVRRALAVSCESQDRDAYGDGFMHADKIACKTQVFGNKVVQNTESKLRFQRTLVIKKKSPLYQLIGIHEDQGYPSH
jgi:hypothetical protein